MAVTSILHRSSPLELRPAQLAGQLSSIRRAQRAAVAAVEVLFGKLHAFNSALDPRFALSEEWETHFDAAILEALRGDESLCLIACEADSHRLCAFALAAVHRDSGIWRYREW